MNEWNILVFLLNTGYIIFLAAFMAKKIFWLRLLTITGNFLVIPYYIFYLEPPLWNTIVWVGVYSAINLVMLFIIYLRSNSKSGWLSFTKPVDNEVYEKLDLSFGMSRTEIRSVSSDIHLGHVFNDGPDGMPRYCINATVLEFVPRDGV